VTSAASGVQHVASQPPPGTLTPPRTRRAARRVRRVSLVAYAALALAVAGPLLASGLVLVVDLSQTPHPDLPGAYYGLPQGTHEGTVARLPLDALFVGLGRLDAVGLGEKVLLLAVVALAGIGMHRLVVVRHAAAAYYAGLLYAVNPFVYDRLDTGQWFLLLGYALLPWAYRALVGALRGDLLAGATFGALFGLTGIASTHMAMLLAAMAVVTATIHGPRLWREPAVGRAVGLGGVLAGLSALCWLVPTPGLREFWQAIGPAHLELYRSLPNGSWPVPVALAGLTGYWNNPQPATDWVPAWPLFALTLALLALLGVAARSRDRTTLSVAILGALGLAIALGDASSPTRGAFAWLLDHVSPLRSFREPQKAVALLVFAYAYLGAAGVDDLLEHRRRMRAAAPLLAALLLSVPLVYGHRVLGGLWGRLHTSQFPASWYAADDVLRREAGGSRTLFLPFHGYFALSFAHHRVVANPAVTFFHTPMLTSRDVGGGPRVSDNADPLERRVRGLLDHGAHNRNLPSCLAALGVSHILLAKEADWQRYRYLGQRTDLAVERRWPDLLLLRNTAPAGLAMAGDPGAGCPRGLEPIPLRRLSPVHYRLAGTRSPTTELRLGLPLASSWRVEGRDLRFARWPAYRRNYLLGLAGWIIVAAAWARARRLRQAAGRDRQRG
jgi:hypothetical protein